MLNKDTLYKSLNANINWIMSSGVLDPPNGSWGIAARIVLTENNEALDKIKTSFPSWTEHNGYIIVEHRRADCNFEAAWLFLEAYHVFKEDKFKNIGENILEYLFRKSGMFNTRYEKYPLHVWRWANEKWVPVIYFDDNSWNCFISLSIANEWKKLDDRYNMRHNALLLAEQLRKAFIDNFNASPKSATIWKGDLEFPHWGALTVMALAYAFHETGEEKFLKPVRMYYEYLLSDPDRFCSSEQAYVLFSISAASSLTGDDNALKCAKIYAEKLSEKMNSEYGFLPAEYSAAAPVGENLVDFIYTQNWAILGFHTIYQLTGNQKYLDELRKLLDFTISIQDASAKPHLQGCWRGMYDLNMQTWGGGNCYEGGSDSVYTGWTNIPIALVISSLISGRPLLCRKSANNR